ncbi:MAG: hypothetical protein M4D80_10890 [Myxococcota bacterium]|nr:hypothetical protein [Deltaproteobacteria bacterium]MDQ3335663.1 hypothetical protein [Myxococcota bacterium]
MAAITPEPTHREWSAMLASLATCHGCKKSLGGSHVSSDGFCRECLERSRTTKGDEELGGES